MIVAPIASFWFSQDGPSRLGRSVGAALPREERASCYASTDSILLMMVAAQEVTP